MNRVVITLHAVERYQSRIDPAATREQAKAVIAEEFAVSTRQRQRTIRTGDAVYLGPTLRLIVAEERGERTILTVVSRREVEEEEIPELAATLDEEFRAWNGRSAPAVQVALDAIAQQPRRGRRRT